MSTPSTFHGDSNVNVLHTLNSRGEGEGTGGNTVRSVIGATSGPQLDRLSSGSNIKLSVAQRREGSGTAGGGLTRNLELSDKLTPEGFEVDLDSRSSINNVASGAHQQLEVPMGQPMGGRPRSPGSVSPQMSGGFGGSSGDGRVQRLNSSQMFSPYDAVLSPTGAFESSGGPMASSSSPPNRGGGTGGTGNNTMEDADDLEADFTTQATLNLSMLKAKMFSLFGLLSHPDEAEVLTAKIEAERADSVSAMRECKARNPLHRTNIDSMFRFLYEEVALRWHCQKEEFPYSHRVIKQVVASEIDSRVEAQQKYEVAQIRSRELQVNLKIAEELTERRKAQYAINVSQYHKELNLHHARIAELQKKLDIRDSIPHLLEGADEEDDAFRRMEKDERQHLEFLYGKTREENLLLAKSNNERGALVQALEDELESERSEAAALRREFRLYLEEQDGIDAAFKEATTEAEHNLNLERIKVKTLTQTIDNNQTELENALEARSSLLQQVEALKIELEEVNALLASAPALERTPSMSKKGARGGKLVRPSRGPEQKGDGKANVIVDTAEVDRLEGALKKVQSIAEDRKVQLEEEQRLKKIVIAELDVKNAEFTALNEKHLTLEKAFKNLKLTTGKSEQAAIFERNREKNFLKKKSGDLQAKLHEQEELMDNKLIEMKQTEADLVNDIMVMHRQFGTVETFLHKKFGPELLQELADHLASDSTLHAGNDAITSETLDTFKEHAEDDLLNEFSMHRVGSQITLSCRVPSQANSPKQGYLSSGALGGLSNSKRPESATSRASQTSAAAGTGNLLVPTTGQFKSIFAKSHMSSSFLTNLRDQLKLLVGSDGDSDAMGSSLHSSVGKMSPAQRLAFRQSVMSEGTNAGMDEEGRLKSSGQFGLGFGGGCQEVEVDNLKMVIEDLIGQQRQNVEAKLRLKTQNEELQEALKVKSDALQDQLNKEAPQSSVGPMQNLRFAPRHNRPQSSRSTSVYSSWAGGGGGGTGGFESALGSLRGAESIAMGADTMDMSQRAAGFRLQDLDEIDRQINRVCANPVDLSILQLFPGVECANGFIDLFESFIGLRRQLAQLVLVCSRELTMDVGAKAQGNPEDAELKKILLNEKFVVFRAIESYGQRLVGQLHKKKEDVMRRREEELERVLSTMQNLSVTHPKEVAQLARVARQSATHRDEVNLQQATKSHKNTRLKSGAAGNNAAEGSLARGTRSRDRVSSAGAVVIESVMTLEVERPMTSMSGGGHYSTSNSNERTPLALPPAGSNQRAASAQLLNRSTTGNSSMPTRASTPQSALMIEDTTTNAVTGVTENVGDQVTVSGIRSKVQRRPAQSAQLTRSGMVPARR